MYYLGYVFGAILVVLIFAIALVLLLSLINWVIVPWMWFLF